MRRGPARRRAGAQGVQRPELVREPAEAARDLPVPAGEGAHLRGGAVVPDLRLVTSRNAQGWGTGSPAGTIAPARWLGLPRVMVASARMASPAGVGAESTGRVAVT
ncbi:MAG: hypothetical protein QJR03_03700 [Sphaerobacter sp.]|nr:hypothetical protein [Sphaerobacter sp.]